MKIILYIYTHICGREKLNPRKMTSTKKTVDVNRQKLN